MSTPRPDRILTVILLTYNHEPYIAKALDSILAQKTTFDFCIHILDDCSTDETSYICSQYQQAWPEKIIHCRNEENLGVERNLKQGFLQIKSRYIAFLEGDDYWTDPGKLQMQVEMLEKNPECTLCGHNVLMKDHKNGTETLFVNTEPATPSGIYSLEDKLAIHPSSRIYRNCIDLSDIPEFMVLDTHIYRLFLSKGRCCYIDKTMSVYNKTGTGYWSGKEKSDKKAMTLRLTYASLKYHDFSYEPHAYRNSPVLALFKQLFGIRRGWWIFYRYESLRLAAKHFLGLGHRRKSS